MNVFEDLIGELKEENLLEGTVLDLPREPASRPHSQLSAAVGRDADDLLIDFDDGWADNHPPAPVDDELPKLPAENTGADFYRKRAMEEVSSLQMVEHLFSAIEREHLKSAPAASGELDVKKALHKFLQLSENNPTAEYSEAEFELLHRIECWSTALAARDQNISVANLRRYCENSRPVLSSQALMALARFYRNTPYSEASRAKFDFVITRLFSRETEDEKRKLLFGRSEMIGHIETLYANWSSVSLYEGADSEAGIAGALARFEAMILEAEQSTGFYQLATEEFFDRLRKFKETLCELFFAPTLTAASIECNVRIGNRFVELITAERGRTSPENIEEKYGYTYDQILSEAAGKTLHLVELMKSLPQADPAAKRAEKAAMEVFVPTPAPPKSAYEAPRRGTFEIFKVNKWLLAATIAIAVLSAIVYLAAGQFAPDDSSVPATRKVDLTGSEFEPFLKAGGVSETTLFATTQPGWEKLSEERQKEVLTGALHFAERSGAGQVQLINSKGKTVAFASKDRVEISRP